MRRLIAPYKVSWTNVLLPLPLTPVTQVKSPSGNSTLMFLRLCCRAPLRISLSAVRLRRVRGTGIRASPLR